MAMFGLGGSGGMFPTFYLPLPSAPLLSFLFPFSFSPSILQLVLTYIIGGGDIFSKMFSGMAVLGHSPMMGMNVGMHMGAMMNMHKKYEVNRRRRGIERRTHNKKGRV